VDAFVSLPLAQVVVGWSFSANGIGNHGTKIGDPQSTLKPHQHESNAINAAITGQTTFCIAVSCGAHEGAQIALVALTASWILLPSSGCIKIAACQHWEAVLAAMRVRAGVRTIAYAALRKSWRGGRRSASHGRYLASECQKRLFMRGLWPDRIIDTGPLRCAGRRSKHLAEDADALAAASQTQLESASVW
jgi:hypothetical protein